MPDGVSLQTAREILAVDVLGPEEIRAAFGEAAAIDSSRAGVVPFSVDELRMARREGFMLVLRTARCGDDPITLLWLIRKFPDAFDEAFLRKTGYQLKDDWGIELEPLAAVDAPESGWALARKDVLEETCNVTYEEQDGEVRRYASKSGLASLRRRSAIEIAYDLIAYRCARRKRLLENAWDWSLSRTADGGYLNLGHFTDAGMQVFSYSMAVRHGRLGVCPNLSRGA
jgi:hypothetical protein